jgi:hypothetical protein
VINLGDREPMDAQIHPRARAPRRCRTCERYSSTVIVSAVPKVHFGAATGDLQIPRLCRAGLGSCVKAADQLERQSGTLLNRKTKDLSMSAVDTNSV